MDRLTLPNLLTLLRVAVALTAGRMVLRSEHLPFAVALLAAAALLDAVDGWVARTFARCTRLGTHIDPLADKLLVAVMFAWIGADAASPWVWSLIGVAMAREVVVTMLRLHCARHGHIMPASPLGRWKMFMQSSSGLVILSSAHLLGRPMPAWTVAAALLAVLVLSAASAIGYFRAWRGVRVEAIVPPKHALPPRVKQAASGG